jgi:hypothetical protein
MPKLKLPPLGLELFVLPIPKILPGLQRQLRLPGIAQQPGRPGNDLAVPSVKPRLDLLPVKPPLR